MYNVQCGPSMWFVLFGGTNPDALDVEGSIGGLLLSYIYMPVGHLWRSLFVSVTILASSKYLIIFFPSTLKWMIDISKLIFFGFVFIAFLLNFKTNIYLLDTFSLLYMSVTDGSIATASFQTIYWAVIQTWSFNLSRITFYILISTIAIKSNVGTCFKTLLQNKFNHLEEMIIME